jgi:glutamine synthetase
MASDKTVKKIIAEVMQSPGNRVKVAVVDIDGVLRGKYIHKEKFASAAESGFGFCDVVYGWDSGDVCYDNTTSTGWHKGFPDALARIDFTTHRNVPWDGGVDFFLGSFVREGKHGREPMPLDPRQVLARVLARAAKLGLQPLCSLEFEFFNFAETPQSWAAKKGVDPETLTPGMFG